MPDSPSHDRACESPSPRVASGIVYRQPLVFEQSRPGRRGCSLPPRLEGADEALSRWPAKARRTAPLRLPELSEPEVVRHYTRLSRWNHGVDTGFYPLGSCTMKYNPRLGEALARLEGFADVHPAVPDVWAQGALELMWELEQFLCELGGMSAVSLQPAAGAHGEFTGVRMIRHALIDREGTPRRVMLVPASAHGTNPASCAMNGYEVVEVPANERGVVSAAAVAELMDADTAGIMITNPNTLGLFEEEMARIAEIVHERGGFVYCDGANLNALLGRSRPGDFGADVVHFNLHKTFSTPHGGGGPGAGPVGASDALEPYLPVPRVRRIEGTGNHARFVLDEDFPRSIGRVRSWYGNFGVMVRAWAYIREMGAEGLRKATDLAVLAANYLRVRLAAQYPAAFDRTCMHECVLTDVALRPTGVQTLDVAKRLLDWGIHPPTIYFPLCVRGALMIEPTETEPLEELDAFVAAMEAIAREARERPEVVRNAPHCTGVRRIDEVGAARRPILRWEPAAGNGATHEG